MTFKSRKVFDILFYLGLHCLAQTILQCALSLGGYIDNLVRTQPILGQSVSFPRNFPDVSLEDMVTYDNQRVINIIYIKPAKMGLQIEIRQKENWDVWNLLKLK